MSSKDGSSSGGSDGEAKHGRHELPDDYEVPSTAVEESESPAESEDTEDSADTEAEAAGKPAKFKISQLDPRDRVVLIIGLVAVVAFGAIGGWIDYRAYHEHQNRPQRELFLEAGKRAAQNLTTIDYHNADADVKRVLDSATGSFFKDFERRAPSFTDVVKQLKSKSTGTIAAAGVESASADTAKVLVAVTVNTEVVNGPPQPVRAFRMRLTVEKTGDDAKVSNVEFVQ